MGLKEFKIYFDQPYATYHPNQTVTGKIILELDSPKKVRGIKLSVKGEADTYWSIDRQELNNEGRYINETDSVVTGHEEYFKAHFYVLGSASGQEIELLGGAHTYPFNYVLPPNLPSSFESDFGRIRYTAKACLDRPWKFDQETKVAFTVISHFDLNKEPTAMEQVDLEESKTFCCLCCGSPPLTVNVRLPVKGYVPGQSIPVNINVENNSGIIVDTIKLKLLKTITYSATTPRTETKIVDLKVSEVSKGPVNGNETISYVQNLDVPPVPPSFLNNCGLINLEYKLLIEGCVSGFYHRNLITETKILIGTVPLSSYQMPLPAANSTPGYPTKSDEGSVYPPISAPSAPDEPAGYNPPGLYPNLAPPTYEESIYHSRSLRDREESEHVIGSGDKFAPRYPVYNFKPSE